MDDRRRCARGNRCEDAQKVVDANGASAWSGALVIDEARAFCPTCLRYLRYALNGMRLDVVELTTLLIPSMEVRYRDPDMPTQQKVKLHSPVPLDLNAEALRALIVHETTSWAASVAAEVDLPWDAAALHRSRDGAAVDLACTFIVSWLDHFLGLPPQRHEVRSTGVDPLDGWSADDWERMEHDDDGRSWIHRNGTDGALRMFELHDRVESFVGRTPADAVAMPCPKCQRPALVREHRTGKVMCRCCWREMTDADYEALVEITSDLFGMPA